MSESTNQFPILNYSDYKNCPKYVRWDKLDNEWAIRVHDQTLNRLSDRGGLDPLEIVFNIEKLEWGAPVNMEHALNVVREISAP